MKTERFKINFAIMNNQQEQQREGKFTIDEMREAYGIGFMQKGIIGFNEFIKKINKPAQNKEVKTLQEMHVEVDRKKDIEFLSKEDFSKYIVWSGCSQYCKGGQHVGRTCAYMIGEVKEIDLMARCGSHRSMIKNREIVIDCLYDMYLKS